MTYWKELDSKLTDEHIATARSLADQLWAEFTENNRVDCKYSFETEDDYLVSFATAVTLAR